jgi:hypothetical protein
MNKLKTTELIAWYKGLPEFAGHYLIKYSYGDPLYPLSCGTKIGIWWWDIESKQWIDDNAEILRNDAVILLFAPVPKGT